MTWKSHSNTWELLFLNHCIKQLIVTLGNIDDIRYDPPEYVLARYLDYLDNTRQGVPVPALQ